MKPLTIETMPPRATQKASTPANVNSPRFRQRRRSAAAALDRLMSLIGMRGSTQGVKLSRKPPNAASSRIMAAVSGDSASNAKPKPNNLNEMNR